MDQDFAMNQSSFFEKEGIPVTYCVPTYDCPRGPLYLGLPTIEAHRWQSLDNILLDLYCTYHAQSILLSDNWISEDNLKLMDEFLNSKEIDIPVVFDEDISEEEKQIVLGNHSFRYDSNTSFLRSRSSREMAECGSKIEDRNCVDRKVGDITIDNELYLRYSGELQVVLQDAKADKRVNVVAHLQNCEDIKKLSYFRSGITYRFVSES